MLRKTAPPGRLAFDRANAPEGPSYVAQGGSPVHLNFPADDPGLCFAFLIRGQRPEYKDWCNAFAFCMMLVSIDAF